MKTLRRNDPCPCGSGKKYKHCCLQKEEPEATSDSYEAIPKAFGWLMAKYPDASGEPLDNGFFGGLNEQDYKRLQARKSFPDGQKERGLWAGKGAQMLGLRGQVSWQQFVALDNQRPDRKGRLTARNNGTRTETRRVFDPKTQTWEEKEIEVSNRRAGYDICLSAPKSVSLYLTGAIGLEEVRIPEQEPDTKRDQETTQQNQPNPPSDANARRVRHKSTGRLTRKAPVDSIQNVFRCGS